MSNCYLKHGKPEAKKETNVALACGTLGNVGSRGKPDRQQPQELLGYFQSEGFLSLCEGSREVVPVRVVRDTCSTVSIVVKDMVPFVEKAYTGKRVNVEGIFGPQGVQNVPVCRLFLHTGYGPRYVDLAVVEKALPVKGVALLIGNDIAGPQVLPKPIVPSEPSKENQTKELEEEGSEALLSCAVTRSQSAKGKQKSELSSSVHENTKGVKDKSIMTNACGGDLPKVSDWGETFHLETLFDEELGVGKISGVEDLSQISITRELLAKAQLEDQELIPLFSKCISDLENRTEAICFYNKDGVLMRRFRPYRINANYGDWNDIHQIVLPTCYRNKVINLAPDYIGGHLGVKKTRESILKHFS